MTIHAMHIHGHTVGFVTLAEKSAVEYEKHDERWKMCTSPRPIRRHYGCWTERNLLWWSRNPMCREKEDRR